MEDTLKPRTIDIRLTTDTIAVSADDLWAIMGPGFTDVGRWTTGVDHAYAVGAPEIAGAPCKARTCEVSIAGYDTVTETLTAYDASARHIAWKITEGVPGFVLLAENRWVIQEVAPGQSVAHMHCTLKLRPIMGLLLGWLMKRQVLRNVHAFSDELKLWAERGEVSGAKRLRMQELGRPVAV